MYMYRHVGGLYATNQSVTISNNYSACIMHVSVGFSIDYSAILVKSCIIICVYDSRRCLITIFRLVLVL